MRHALSILALTLALTGCASLNLDEAKENFRSLSQGMTETQVVEQVGRPSNINRTKASYGTRTQFVYRAYGGPGNAAYVYFRDGRLSSVQY